MVPAISKKPFKLSDTSKMPSKSFSLEAGKTCVGMVDSDGNIKEKCIDINGKIKCYALKGFYQFKQAKNLRKFNLENIDSKDWVSSMVQEIGKKDFFRWFDSGDIFSLIFAEKIKQVIEQTPQTKHWLPTTIDNNIQTKFLPIHCYIRDKIKPLKNVSVRFSSGKIDSFDPEIHGSVVISDLSVKLDGVTNCLASLNQNKCGTCRKCWDKNGIIGYPYH